MEITREAEMENRTDERVAGRADFISHDWRLDVERVSLFIYSFTFRWIKGV
jgi:hypothetical protein